MCESGVDPEMEVKGISSVWREEVARRTSYCDSGW